MDANTEKSQYESLEPTWKYIAKNLYEKTNEAVFKLCFDNMKFVYLDDKKAVFSVPINTSKTLIEARYFEQLKNSITEALTFCPEEIQIIVEPDPSKSSSSETRNEETAPPAPVKTETKNYNYPFPEYTFENFVEGNSNEFARAAAISMFSVAPTLGKSR